MTKKILSFEKNVFPLKKDFWKQEFSIELEQLEPLAFQQTSYEQKLDQLFKTAELVILSDQMQLEVFNNIHNMPTNVSISRAADCLIRQNDKWWPRNFWIESLQENIISKSTNFESRSAAYVTGENILAKSAIYVVIQMGFSKIFWIVEDESLVLEMCESIKRNYFGIELIVIENKDLTLQPSNGSILINNIEFIHNEELIKDLSYLNFIKKNGVVVDTVLLPLESFLLNEAKNINLQIISAAAIEGLRDFKMLKTAFPIKFQMSESIYLEKWDKFLKTRPTSS